MLEKLSNIFQISELRNRLIYTFVMFMVFRAGIHICRRCLEQVFHFRDEYYPVHQRIDYHAVVDGGCTCF